MADRRRAAVPFLAIGIACLAIGIAGNRAFLGVGVVFLALAIVRGRR